MVAPKNGKPSQQAFIGRPLAFKSDKELQAKIDEYFAYCDNRIKTFYSDKTMDEVTYNNPAPYTMAGLAYFLDIDRKTIVNYSKRDEYFPTIARARAKVQDDLETRIMESRTPQGGIFLAKNNFAYVDESKQTLDANVTSTNELSPEALAVLSKASRADHGVTEPE
ncbi:terminase small subunit [Cryobacterium sp. GrIS_2_6]|uniref:terminase small subunit n=1 Tax=Cryobacterium sp. GrIS_2_6 TaxID=3162785 RepID=UPI002E0731D3|nr:hypothetical protein [Cryobacterium psychrotolerans]